MMSIVSNTRVDIVARGVIKACLELGYDPSDKIGCSGSRRLEEEGFQDPEKYGVRVLDRTVSMHEAAGAPWRRSTGATSGNGTGP